MNPGPALVDASFRNPYRERPERRVAPTRVHYRPGASIWTVLLVLIVAFPIALAARRQLPGAQRTVTCTTMAAASVPRCTAWDRATGDVRRGPCEFAQEEFDRQIDDAGFLETPVITVVSTVGPVEAKPIPAANVFVGRLNTAVFPRVPESSASDAKVAAEWNKIERPADGTMTPGAARSLLAVCAAAPAAEAEQRTLALMIVPRDDRGAALVLLVALILIGLLAARSAVVVIDPEQTDLRIAERFGLLPWRQTTVPLDDIVDVVVAQGSKGPLIAHRVELVLRGGSRVPLMPSFTPFSSRAHERTARALRVGLGHVVT